MIIGLILVMLLVPVSCATPPVPAPAPPSSTEDAATETIREVIGQWVDEGWPGGAVITMTRENESIIVDTKFNDSSRYTCEMVEKTVAGQQRFEEKEGNEFGEYYVINARGDLDLYDEFGYIRTAYLKK